MVDINHRPTTKIRSGSGRKDKYNKIIYVNKKIYLWVFNCSLFEERREISFSIPSLNKINNLR